MNTPCITNIPQLLFKKRKFREGITRYIKKVREANRKEIIKWFLVFLMSLLILIFVSFFFTPAVLEITVKLKPIENMMPVIEYSVLAALSPIWKFGKSKDKTTVITEQTTKILIGFISLIQFF